MQKIILTLVVAILLSGCVTTNPSGQRDLLSGVSRIGPNSYYISEMNLLFGNPTNQAIRQCALSGKQMKITGNTSHEGIASNRSYSTIYFDCV